MSAYECTKWKLESVLSKWDNQLNNRVLQSMVKMDKGKLKIIFIAGSGRCGTTLMDNAIGQMPNAFSAGEVRYFWDRGLQQNRLCSCGESFRECPVWSAVTKDLYGQINEAEASRWVLMRDRIKNKY